MNNPINATDPTGTAIETVWDVINVALGVSSFGVNVASGNYISAAIDVGGLLVDGAAAFLNVGMPSCLRRLITGSSLISI